MCSCEKGKNDFSEETAYHFVTRSTDYVIVKNAYRIEMGKETGESKFDGTYYVRDAASNLIKFEDYIVKIETSSFTTEMTMEPGFDINNYTEPADPEMERQLNAYFNSLKSSSLKLSTAPQLNLVTVEYRTEELRSLVVKSDVPMFDKAAGESLNEHIEIFGGSILFDYSKQLIGVLPSGTSIEKHLSYRPLVSAYMELRFKTIPTELPVDGRIIVEMELANGKVLKDTSDVVKLIP